MIAKSIPILTIDDLTLVPCEYCENTKARKRISGNVHECCGCGAVRSDSDIVYAELKLLQSDGNYFYSCALSCST